MDYTDFTDKNTLNICEIRVIRGVFGFNGNSVAQIIDLDPIVLRFFLRRRQRQKEPQQPKFGVQVNLCAGCGSP